MNDWGYDEMRAGPGGVLLLMGVALGAAAAFLLGTVPGRQIRRQIADRTSGWTAQAADTLAQNREKLIATVEQQQSNPSAGSVREKPF